MDALAQVLAAPAGTPVVYALTLLVTLGSIMGAVTLFSWRLERHDHFARRAVALGALVAVVAVVAFLGASELGALESAPADPSGAFSYLEQLGIFSALLVFLVATVCWLFDASVWTALFCCTAGYALQNFASGLTELVWMACGVTEAVDASLGGNLVRCTLNLTCIAVVYVPFYRVFIRNISREGLEQISDRSLLVIMVVVMLGIIGFDLVIKDLSDHGLGLAYVAALRSFHGMACALTYALEYELLVSRHLRVEQAATERVLAERERQYQRSRENVEAINIKCHDIRHQIRHLADGAERVDPAALADIAREVDVYDSTVETGNEALDTILSEKSLACSRLGITLSCVADGAALGFMAPADIYSLFGNALDNAMEAVEALADPTRRSISLVVRVAAGVVSVHVENHFGGELRFGTDGALVTSKADPEGHGLGVRSMRLIVERYGGTLATLAEGDTFHLNAMIPLP